MSADSRRSTPLGGSCSCLRVRLMIGAMAAAGILAQAGAEEAEQLASQEQGASAPMAPELPVSQASAADRLRDDPVQTATVPQPVVKAPASVRLTKDERTIARHISRTYRVGREAVERFVHYAYKTAREVRLDPHLLLAVMAVVLCTVLYWQFPPSPHRTLPS